MAAACVALGFVLVFGVDQWELRYPVLFLPLLTVVRARPSQVAVTLAFVEATAYLGGFPNLPHDVRLNVDAVR